MPGSDKMNNKYLVPIIIFFVAFIILIVILLVLRSKKKSKFKKTIEELELAKNSLIGVPILTEL